MPHFGWRAVFFAGIAPGPHHPLAAAPTARAGGLEAGTHGANPNRPAVPGALGRNVLICATMNAATLFAWWGLFTWMPRFLSMSVAEGGRGLSIVQTSGWTIVMQGGTFLGYVCFGYIADRFSRKYTYIGLSADRGTAGAAVCFCSQSDERCWSSVRWSAFSAPATSAASA